MNKQFILKTNNRYHNLINACGVLIVVLPTLFNIKYQLYTFNTFAPIILFIAILFSIMSIVNGYSDINSKVITYYTFFPLPVLVKIDYAKANVKNVSIKNNSLIISVKRRLPIKVHLNSKIYKNADSYARELLQILEVEFEF